MGQKIMPVDKLDDLITLENLVQQLNARNIFDFMYSPAEGDNLQIREEYVRKGVKGISRPDL